MLFRVSSFDICHIYRMEKEQVYMTVGEPESSVILKYIWGTASEQEKGEVDLWLKKHPENEKALLQIARIYYVCRTQERIVSRDPLKAYWKVDKMLKSQSYLKKYQKKDRYVIFHRIVIELLKVAAIALILLGGNFLLQKDDQMESLPSFQTLYVPAGQRAELILPDSTKVWLNANSKLVYPTSFKKGIRQVELDGEAYFEVRKNEKLPFDVMTKELNVKVLGTKFNFRNYDEDEEVTVNLLEGKVQLENYVKKMGVNYLSPSEKVTLNKLTGEMIISRAEVKNAKEWTNGGLFFDEMPLSDIVKELNRSYNVKIHIADEQLTHNRFYALFNRKEQTIYNVLDIITATNQVRYKVEGDSILLYAK